MVQKEKLELKEAPETKVKKVSPEEAEILETREQKETLGLKEAQE